jgi:UDP-glucose 4-epimerase
VNILISGSAGFLGSHLWQKLRDEGHTVTGVDNMLGGDNDNIIDWEHFHRADCTTRWEMGNIFSLGKFDLVYHCAAAPHEGLSVFSPCVVTENTYMTTCVLAAAAIKYGVRRFVFCSSMSRYGDGYGVYSYFMPFIESMPPRPVDPYGIAKVASEQILQVLGHAHGMEVVILVPHNIVGSRQKYDDPFRNVASIMTNLMLQGRQPIIYGDGNQKRAFSHVSDCVEPLVRAGMQAGINGEVINIGPDDNPITINELAERLAKIIGFKDLNPEYYPDRPCEVKNAWPSANKARKLLGYETRTTLDDALRDVVDWIKKMGPREFKYHLPIEIPTANVPRTWAERKF